MSTELKVWEVKDNALVAVTVTMEEAGRKEVDDLEKWLATNPELIGEGIVIIGEQVQTRSGPLDFLGLDSDGNTVIIELKRGMLARDALAQAIDYASDVATWDVEKLDLVCWEHRDESLDTVMSDEFEELDLEQVTINDAQRIVLVGSGADETLERMIEWLSDGFGVPINAALFKYIRTSSDDELLASTMVIPEEVTRQQTQRRRKKIEMSDEPGKYALEELEEHLRRYLSMNRETPRRIREILLPMCLEHDVVTREMIKQVLVERGEAESEGQAGTILSTMSGGMARKANDFLRQVIGYKGYPREDYGIREDPDGKIDHRDVAQRVLDGLTEQP